MSSAVNYIQNNISVSNYDNARQRQIANAERQITKIDEKINRNNEHMGIIKKRMHNINELINTVNESRDLQAQHITTLKELHDTASQLIDCYEKLLKIRREKNNKVDAPEKTKIVIEAIKS
ncbi:MAG: hypothetical protein AB8B66_06235 [Rickettsiaceae bacterium]